MSDDRKSPNRASPHDPAPDGHEPAAATSKAHRLIAALLGSELAPGDAAQLALHLQSDGALRADYLRQVAMHAVLSWHHGKVRWAKMRDIDPIAIAALLEEAERSARQQAAEEARQRAGELARAAERLRLVEESQRRRTRRRPEPIEIPRSVAYLGALALAASIMWLASTLHTPINSESAHTELLPAEISAPLIPSIATMTSSVEARLTNTTMNSPSESGAAMVGVPVSIDPGTPLSSGRYQLSTGVIGLEFAGGANAILEAPATLEIDSAERINLVQGRLVGSVLPEAIGFTVETPVATIVDLGTEFGVAVTSAERAEVSVFDGEVEVVAAHAVKQAAGQVGSEVDRKRKRLRAGQSASANVEGISVAAPAIPDFFWRTVPTIQEFQERGAYQRWLVYSQSICSNPDVIAYYTFCGQQSGDRRLFNRAGNGESLHGEIRGANWDVGRWPYKQALRFPGADSVDLDGGDVRITLPDRLDSLTLAAWVNVDELLPGHNGLLMTDAWVRTGQIHWQMLVDGRLHVGIASDEGAEKAQSINSQELLNVGAWCHVAVVIDREASRLSFFIDGKSAGTEQVSIPQGVLLGPLRLGNWRPAGDLAGRDRWQSLHGRIDELLVVGRAMNASEIRSLYEAGKPHG